MAGTRPIVLIAFDDTDSATGGCTTALVAEVLAAIPRLALRGVPRLVRLNPNIPHKTRGNAAIALDIGLPTGPRTQVGMWGGTSIDAYPEADPIQPDAGGLDAVWAAITAAAQPDAEPGLVLTPSEGPALVYWQAVRAVVEQQDAELIVQTSGGLARGGRGLIGATAAASWPGPAASYELIGYRDPTRIGTPREIDGAMLGALDDNGTTFHSRDDANSTVACVPNTPCPVLCGLRGWGLERLLEVALPALKSAAREPLFGWMLFASNQASGDHVSLLDDASQAEPLGSAQLPLTVTSMPTRERGGHAGVVCHDALGHTVDIVAFEPTKGFRDTVCALRPGDQVVAVGAWHAGRVHLEKLRVDWLAPDETKIDNPACPQCGRSMKSRGTNAGYRCPDGHGSAPEAAATRLIEQRTLEIGWYEVPVMARRHLHRPLARDAMADVR
jgi:tRNA(Ile2)-agmatinylcytidine synthase